MGRYEAVDKPMTPRNEQTLTTQLSPDDHYNATPLEQSNTPEDVLKEKDEPTQVPIRVQKRNSQKIITFSSTDPDNPNNWPRRTKVMIFGGGIASVLNSTLGSSLPSNAIEFIAQDFHLTAEIQLVLPISCFLMGYVVGPSVCGPLSENFGRKPIMLYAFLGYILFTMACAVAPSWGSFLFFRLCCGIFASAPIAIVGGLYADIFHDPRNRGSALAWFMAATTVGPVIAPALSGFISENTSWRWVFGVGTVFAVATLPFIIMMPESYAPVLLSRKAAKLREETGDPDIIAKTDLQKKSFKYVMTVVMTRPYRMLVQELIVSCVCIYCALAYAIFYMYFQAYPIIFQGPDSIYGWTPGLAGLPFLPIGLGAAICAPLFLWYNSFLAKAQKRNAPWSQIEEYRRLPLACIGGPLYVIALLWIGWTARSDVHWMVPICSGVVFGTGFLLIFMALLNYLSDAYETFAASAQGIASTCRSVFGAVLPLASRPMFHRLGVAWACTLLAFLSMGVSVIPFVFIKYGDKIRANSKFCQQLKAMKAQDLAEEEEERDAQRRQEHAQEQGDPSEKECSEKVGSKAEARMSECTLIEEPGDKV